MACEYLGAAAVVAVAVIVAQSVVMMVAMVMSKCTVRVSSHPAEGV